MQRQRFRMHRDSPPRWWRCEAALHPERRSLRSNRWVWNNTVPGELGAIAR